MIEVPILSFPILHDDSARIAGVVNASRMTDHEMVSRGDNGLVVSNNGDRVYPSREGASKS